MRYVRKWKKWHNIKMGKMEETFVKAEELAEHVKEYINNRMDAIKLNTAEKSSKLAATVIASVVVAMFLVTFLFFASTALAFVFSHVTGSLAWGFLIVGGIYLLLGLFVWLLKDRILQLPIMNALLRQLFSDNEDEDDA